MFFFLVAVLGTLIPTTVYVALVWWIDRYEKEPLWLLALSFLWGAIPAAIISVILEVLVDASIQAVGVEGLIASLASIGISAPLIEESAKGFALIALVLLFYREFDDVLDGIVYGAMIGFGFAMTENIAGYFLPILKTEGIGAGLTNIFLRSFVFGFNHAFWTATLGAAIGYARLCPDWERRLLVPIIGWMLAVSLHAIHNAGVSLVEQTFFLTFGLSLAIDWGGVLLLLLLAVAALRKETGWIERGLAEEVRRGALTREEFDLLRSGGRRLRTRWAAWGQGGPDAYKLVGYYYQCATELAFKKQHLRTLGDERGNLAEIQKLRKKLEYSRSLAWPWLGSGRS